MWTDLEASFVEVETLRSNVTQVANYKTDVGQLTKYRDMLLR